MSSRSCTRLRAIKKRFELKYEIHSCQKAGNSLIDKKRQLQERPKLDTLLQLMTHLVRNWELLRRIHRLTEHELA